MRDTVMDPGGSGDNLSGAGLTSSLISVGPIRECVSTMGNSISNPDDLIAYDFFSVVCGP